MDKLFSPVQNKILEVLKSSGAIKISDLATLVYDDPKKKPLAPRNAVNSAIFYINMKCQANKLDWKIESDEMLGRNGSTVRKVKATWR